MPLPPGVTLAQIDGGPTYYADNGFTYATQVDSTMAAAGAKSWDDPSFFPIGNFWAFYGGNSPSVFKALGFNFTNITDPSVDRQAVLHANGIWNVDNQTASSYGNETIGFHVEEPSSFNVPGSGGNGSVVDQVNASPFSLTGRFIQTAFTWSNLRYNDAYQTPVNLTMPQVFSTFFSTPWGNVRCHIPGADNYMFATATSAYQSSVKDYFDDLKK